MPRCPFAIWTPIAATNQDARVHEKTQVILHTLVGSARGTIAAWQRSNRLESTFIVALDGTLYQCMDSASRADANLSANRSAISIETEDHGVGRNREWDPDRVWVPWTEAQLATIARVLEWAHRTHAIPMERCASPTSAGVGYHSMWGAPSPWTPVAKSCPGPARVRQFDESIQAYLEGRAMPDGTEIERWTQRPLEVVPAALRQRLVVDDRHPLISRRSTRPAAAGRNR
jgi:N-acetyl-anhydromuramyl-L-alanine amidase AmpD